MTWRRFHLVLCLIMVAITILRLATGNLIGALFSAVLAAVFGSVAMDYPLLSRLRQIGALVWRRWGGGKG